MSKSQSTLKKAMIMSSLTGAVLSIPVVTSAHFGHETLKKGMYNDHVVTLQKALKHHGYYKLSKETGYFGTTTEKAVKKFQKDKGLKVDGLVGPKTKAALNHSHSSSTKSKIIEQGSHGEEVKHIQERLKQLGYYHGTIDGIFGSLTKSAVISFQQINRLNMDGLVGKNTLSKLDNHPKAYRKSEVSTRQVQTSRSINVKAVREFYVSSTAYTAYCAGCSGKTATGIDLRANPNAKVVAVDPNIIPLGSKLYVEGYGYAVAGDTGSAIKGNRIDLFMSSLDSALKWGRRTVKVKILELP